MKFIGPKLHGYIDYLVVGFLLISPNLFDFSSFVVGFTYTLAGIHLMLTLVTDFNAGLFKIVPLKIHGIIEFFAGIFICFSPWILGFSKSSHDMIFYMVFGFAVLLIFTFSEYQEKK